MESLDFPTHPGNDEAGRFAPEGSRWIGVATGVGDDAEWVYIPAAGRW